MLQELQVTRRISGGEIIANLGLEVKADAVIVGVVTLLFSNTKLILSDTLYVPF